MRIYLIGYMGSGKSVTGKKLAKRLGYSYVDLDKYIEQKYRITIPDIFTKFDEKAFRLIERKSLKQTFVMENVVVSTGGGTPCFFDNIKLMNGVGFTIYIQMDIKNLYERLINSRKKRPLLAQKNPNEIQEHIKNQLAEREAYYLQSDSKIDGENINLDALVETLANDIKNKHK